MNTVGFWGDLLLALGEVVDVVVLDLPAATCPLCVLPASVTEHVAFLPSSRAFAAANWF
jgi:hypothetical protein